MKKLSIINRQLSIVVFVLLTGCGASESASLPTSAPATTETAATVTPSTETVAPTPPPTVTPTKQPLDPTPTTTSVLPTLSPTPSSSASALASTSAFYPTYQQPDGNRVVPGRGNLPNSQPIDIPLAGEPTWLVAAPITGGATIWVVTLADGRVQAFTVSTDGRFEPAAIDPTQLPPGMPPLLQIENANPSLLLPSGDDFSPLTHPVPLAPPNRLAYVTRGGGLVIESQAGIIELDVAPLPDTRILVDEQERLLLLTDPTTDYRHAVLGDGVEAKSITLIETRPVPRVVATIPVPEASVVEGIAPLWADLTGDGVREIIVTLSNTAQGAQLVAYNEAGEQIAAGPAIGQGNRWRHQLAVAPFGPTGELELADVLTPHLGRIAEFFRLDGASLAVAATVPGYTSHRLGSRNLDTAAAGDFDGDGSVELLLPNADFTELGAMRRTTDGADVVWTVPVDSLIATNVAVVTTGEEHLVVGVGRVDWVLRIWR